MFFKLLVYYLLNLLIFHGITAWNLNIVLSPKVIIGEVLQIKCLVIGSSSDSPIQLFCPMDKLNIDQPCFENCKKLIYDTNNVFNKLNCQYNINDEEKSLIYFTTLTDSWQDFNNSHFKCKFLDKSQSIPFIIQKKNNHILLQYIDIIILIGLVIISLSFNVAFCSWYSHTKKNNRLKKRNIKMENFQVHAEENLQIPNHKRKCRSLDLPQRKEMQHNLMRNQSVFMIPYYFPHRVISPSMSISSQCYPADIEQTRLINPQMGREKPDINIIKFERQMQGNHQGEQVSSFKSAMENKISENLVDGY